MRSLRAYFGADGIKMVIALEELALEPTQDVELVLIIKERVEHVECVENETKEMKTWQPR